MKIGLLFGTFDPIHVGHISIAQSIISRQIVDVIQFVITPTSPDKIKKKITSKSHRMNMVDLATENFENMTSSDLEFQLPKPQYTSKTLSMFKRQQPDDEFIIIMGSDNYINISKWKNAKYIINNFKICVYNRRGSEPSSYFENTIVLDAIFFDISSSIIRSDLYGNRQFLSPGVFNYIKSNSIYL